jgi:glutamine synthetase
MTGSPNLVVRPDPATFRVLPWAPGVAWVLGDEYFRDGTPFHFSPRHLLKNELEKAKQDYVVGLEVEWYVARLAEEHLAEENVAVPGVRGRAPRTTPVEPGFSYHRESGMDLLQPLLSELARAYAALGLPLRSIEKEWGPGQIECTFAAQDALAAADAMLLFRTATRQVCRRLGFLATFMARPALKGYYASGWHLHQSLMERGKNAFTPRGKNEILSPTGLSFLGGLLSHAAASTVFATPTVNGYRRYKPNSLAPDRAGWGYDHRGAMVRVLGGAGDQATRLESRLGEPAANPYLYIASQLAAGRDGMERSLDPGPRDEEPYAAERPRLPASLGEALDALERDRFFRGAFGDVFIDYYLKLKRSELGRFEAFMARNPVAGAQDQPTQWEQDEYFDFF